MISISEFFKRIGGIHADEIAFRSDIKTVIKESVGVDLPIESISFRSGAIILKNVSQVARAAIFTKKPDIIGQANATQSFHRIDDIR